jgi:hypothetical protein
MENPIQSSQEVYLIAHAEALKDIQSTFTELDDPKNSAKILKGMTFGQKMGVDFYDTFAKMKEEKKNQGFTEDQLEQQIVKPEYNEGIQEFMSRHMKEWNKLSDLEKKSATFFFLNGVRLTDVQGKNTRIKRVLSLLPVYLMHKPTLFEYGKAYAKYAYKPITKTPRGSDLRVRELTKKFATIEELEGKRCG